ncbi:ankyrin repeat domain-containing protein 7-like [Halyomorpha halys]|uniref:ankyrin repeat domain-containing protein 7-like n=1 Tax=Halyomorpha halys TaxID=286706 RepID=UPI0034D23425
MNRTYGILQEAAWKGDNDLLKWLLSRNVEIDSRDDLGNTALHLAAKEGHLATVKFLLDHKASIFVLNSERRRPFDLALNSEQFDICDILYPMPTQKSFESMILDFVREGNVRKLQYLLKKNEWCYIWSALSVAVEKRYPKLVDMLLQNCLRLSLVPNEHNTIILTKAISNGDRIIVEKLLAAGFEMEDSLISLAMENKLYEFLNNCDHKSIIDTVD